MELTLTTLAEISTLIQNLDERLAQLNPELPRVCSGTFSSAGFKEMLTAYEQVFGAFEQAANAAKALGFEVDAAALASTPPRTVQVSKTNPTGSTKPTASTSQVTETVKNEAPVVAEEIPATQVEVEKPAEVAAQQTEKVQLVVEESAGEVVAAEETAAPELQVIEGFVSHRQTNVAPSGFHVRSDSELTKPLKPIEMPAADYEVGAMICQGASIIYAHGPEVKKHWPGTATAKGKVDGLIPADAWRLCLIDSHIFCAKEDSVSVLKLGDLHSAGTIPGKFVAQGRTGNSWVGVREDGNALSVMFKDKKGKTFMGGEKLGEVASEKVFLDTVGECAFVAVGGGDVFRVEGVSAEHIANAGAYVTIAGFAVDSQGVFITNQSADGVWITMLDHNGRPVLRSATLAATVSHQPVIIDDMLYLFDDKKSEVVSVSLDTLQEVKRAYVDGVTSIGQMIAVKDDDGGALALISTNADERPTAALLHSIESGETVRICPITGVRAQLGYAEGHVVVASSSAMQNLIQVFSAYSAAGAKSKAA